MEETVQDRSPVPEPVGGECGNMAEPDFVDSVRALAQIQATVQGLRRVAEETSDPQRRDACLRIAAAIEEQARKLDRRRP